MPLKTDQQQLPELNLTPMIDIVFLLIIFFMVGTKFAEMERTVDLQVPRVQQMGALSAVPSRWIINVFRDGTILLDDRDVSVDQLTDELQAAAQAQPGLGIVVRGDATCTYQDVVGVLTACRSAGVRDLGISVQLDGSEIRR